MAVQRMEHVGIVVEDLPAAIKFFVELGLGVQGEGSVEQVWRERAAIYPQNRVLEPREVAQVIAFLCSDAAGGINGEAVTVALGGIW